MLSDFGTSQDMLNARTRSGNTGTLVVAVQLAYLPSFHHLAYRNILPRLEYSAPESLPVPTTRQLLQVDSKADMWSLGMILHKLIFFRLPYTHTSDNDDPSRRRDGQEYADRLEAEILEYPGFRSTPNLQATFDSRQLPKAYLLLLEKLLSVKPALRPSSERVLGVIKEGGVRMVPEILVSMLTRPITTAQTYPPRRYRSAAVLSSASTSNTRARKSRAWAGTQPSDRDRVHDRGSGCS